MSDPSYGEIWKTHQALMREQQLAAGEKKMAQVDHDLAKQNLEQGRDTATPDQRRELEKNYFDTQATLEQKTDRYVQAQTAVAQLQLRHPEHAEALEQNIAPKDPSPSLMEQAKNTARIAGVVAQSLSPDLPAMPVAEAFAAPPPPHHELPLQQRPEEIRRQTQESVREVSEAVNAERNRPAGQGPGPDPAEVTPSRVPANDNEPPGRGGGAPAAAAAVPANDNTPQADVSQSRFARDFAAPLPPPPPPPPPPPEQEHRLAR
ncbi:MAG: hypothetical protein KF788_18620 [Piscinibacter sp.]|nr:hypothetical protein [Piscinibacter sp.]